MRREACWVLDPAVIERLRALQIERRLSWRKLAAEMGVNRESLARAMKGGRIWSVDIARITNWLAEQTTPKRKASK
jgi:transcriptional regulator with XRE-family HTH domain